jgi:uncharacterized protein (TIGR03067 family)
MEPIPSLQYPQPISISIKEVFHEKIRPGAPRNVLAPGSRARQERCQGRIEEVRRHLENTVTRQTKDKTVKATFQVDPSKEPKQFDAKGEEDGKEAKALGIYKFEDGKLTICSVRGRGKELKRPKKFSTEGGTKEAAVILVVLKKAKGE